MESPTPVSRYVAQNSMRRNFHAGSSSAEFNGVEVSEMPQPISHTSKPESSKQKEVICHEIIDVDDVEEDYGGIVHNDGDIYRSGKGKEVFSDFSQDLSNLVSVGSGVDIEMSKNGTVEDFNSNLFYGEDEWIDTYFDDITYDDYADIQSHFDKVDIPPGVEAPFPWLPSCHQNDIKVPMTSTSTISSSQNELNRACSPPDLHSSDSSLPPKPIKIKDLATSVSSKMGTQAAILNLKRKHVSKWFKSGRSLKKFTSSSSIDHVSSQPSDGPPPHSPGHKPLLFFGKNRRSYGSCRKSPPYATLSSTVNSQSGYPLSIPSNAPGVETYMPLWKDLPLEPSTDPLMNGTVEQRNVDGILQNFNLFKKFDTVEDYSDHSFSKNGSCAKQPPKNWAKRIQEEWKILEQNLPDMIFVRVYESRMDLLRAVIVGAEGTPYHDGLFFFDVFFPTSYPNVPPQVRYHSGGLRINPNLYCCGKVCLSLLNTWSGSKEEKWIPGVSTMLQVLVSIQGLILNAKPYFNEPGYAHTAGSKYGENRSLDYNEKTFMLSLRTMVYSMRRPPKHFEPFVVGHFCNNAREILASCKAYLDGGAQVGCLKGGVQDVDECDKSCSQNFRRDLAGFITTLVNTFCQIGAKDCQEFLSLSQQVNGPANADPPSLPPPNLNKLVLG